MTYSPITPQSQPSPAQTQAQIQTNFAQYALKFLVNHIALNANDQGDHGQVIFEKRLADPGVSEDLVALFCKDVTSASATEPQLFSQIQKFLPKTPDTTNAPNIPIQLTYNSVNIVGPNQYQSFLAGGYLFYFGSTNNIALTITLLPTPAATLMAIASPSNLNGGIPNNVNVLITLPDKIKISSSTAVGGDTFYWLAIAKANP